MTTSGRLTYDRRFNYDNKVLLENWYEERQHYVQNKHKHVSYYSINYVPKPYSKPSEDIIWNQIVMNHGSGPRILIDHHGSTYHGNFSTTYDLAYNHMPKWSKTQKFRKRFSKISHALEPQQDYCRNYGNVTDYGIRAQKKIDWKESKTDTLNSVYQDSYLWPLKSNYERKRFVGQKGKSSSVVEEINKNLLHMKLRDKGVPVAFDFPVKMPKRHDCPLLLKCRPF